MSASQAGLDNRFQACGLRPLDRRASPGPLPGAGRAKVWRGWGRPLRLFDWLLLTIEVAGALVVGWLVLQYVYTAYFDTAPRRLSPLGRQAVTPNPTRQPASVLATTPTATRFAEVLPPMVGEPLAGESRPTPPVVPPTATATPTVDPQLLLPARLRIPVMFLDSPVHEVQVNMGKWEVSPMQIGHHEGTANPGELGNVVLAGHRDINSALFRELDRLQPGDSVFVSNSLREYRYIVQESLVVGPDHTEVMLPTADKRVTLITCTPIGLATQRLIVTALLDEEYPGK